MNYEDVSAELKQKALECKTPEELLELAASAGYKLTEEEVKGIVAGSSWCGIFCTDKGDIC